MAWSDSDLIAAGYDPRSGKRLQPGRLVPRFPDPASQASLAGRGGEQELLTPADSKNALAAATGTAVNVALGRSGYANSGDAGVPRQLSAYARSKLQPEQLLQVQCIEQLRPRLVPGAKLFSLNGELPGGTDLFVMWQAVRKAMGYEPGTPDLCACHAGRMCFIELKRPRGEADLIGHRKARGELSSPQRLWRAWAKEQGFDWVVARSVADVEAALISWKMI